MSEIMIKRNIDIKPTPEELAKCFCGMESDKQARFFCAISDEVDKWDESFVFQLQAVIDSYLMDSSAANVMKQIGEYGNAWKPVN
jgi:hypothetical protein